jgi:hypothetical protein
MIEVRRLRRVVLGDVLAVEFESTQTLAYQAQEIVYVERLSRPEDIEHELAVWKRLLPGPNRLTATLFIELDDPGTIRADLTRLGGIQHALRIEVEGGRVAGVEIPAPDDEPGGETSTVHLLRFDFDEAARAGFLAESTPARIVVDHPELSASAPLTGLLRSALAGDLTADG